MITMQDLAIIFKSLMLFCIVWFTELFISLLMLLSFVPADVKDFCEDVKTPIAVLVSISIFILTVIRILKESKSKDDKK